MVSTRGVHRSGRVGFVPNPNPTRIIQVEENMTRNQPKWSGQIFRFGSCRFRVVSVWVSGFIARNNFWLDSARSGRNLAGSVEVWPRFRRITARSRRIWSRMLNILPETLKVSEIWSKMLNILSETLKVSVRVGHDLSTDLSSRNIKNTSNQFFSTPSCIWWKPEAWFLCTNDLAWARTKIL